MDNLDMEARNFISLIFDGYLKRKKEKRLYSYNNIPQMIIKTYYDYVKRPEFDRLLYNFKRRYFYNENKMEDVHTPEEQHGLRYAYDYILERKYSSDISIYDLSWIHERLYSKTPYPEVGGKYRNEERYLLGKDQNGNILTGNVELTPHWLIVNEMNKKNKDVVDLVNTGLKIHENINLDELINYIYKCVKLNCELIKIHPFSDGNGRSIRIFTNLLFSLADIPPVYIENKEKEKYIAAMNKALVDDNFDEINQFYLYKICDSIIALDINLHHDVKKHPENNENPHKKK